MAPPAPLKLDFIGQKIQFCAGSVAKMKYFNQKSDVETKRTYKIANYVSSQKNQKYKLDVETPQVYQHSTFSRYGA